MREIKRKFTRSELAIMSWRSREQSAAMAKNRHKPVDRIEQPKTILGELPDYGLQHKSVSRPASKVIEHEDSYELPSDINNGVAIPKTFFNDEGDLDLSKVTGPQAVKYLNGLGLRIPTIFR